MSVAGALRPVLVLMALASVFLLADGISDTLAGHLGLGTSSFVFAAGNAVVALFVARGSERSLLGRIGLSVFFIVERPLTASLFGPKVPLSIGLHAATATIELVILFGALRVWRLGRGFAEGDVEALFSLDEPIAPSLPLAGAAPAVGESPLAPRTTWLVGGVTLLLGGVLAADGLAAGFVPGGRDWGVVGESSGWLVYLFAVVLLTVAMRAVHGGAFALRLLFALALIFFIERAFSPLALRVVDPVALGLHGLAALIALALALVTAAAIREVGARANGRFRSLEAA